MKTVLTWMRESDERWFQPIFANVSALRVVNARTDDTSGMKYDGLLLTGGSDIDAAFLHQPVPNPGLILEPDPRRDAWEFGAAVRAVDEDKPVLAICRGLQVLNVCLHGTLHLDIPGHADSPEKDVQPLRYLHTSGRIPPEEGSRRRARSGAPYLADGSAGASRYREAEGSSRFGIGNSPYLADAGRRARSDAPYLARHQFSFVNSSHHQALAQVAPGIEVLAVCATDGVIEQAWMPGRRFVLGTQFHPERGPAYSGLFADFFAAVLEREAEVAS